jgi:hypothetical protein
LHANTLRKGGKLEQISPFAQRIRNFAAQQQASLR